MGPGSPSKGNPRRRGYMCATRAARRISAGPSGRQRADTSKWNRLAPAILADRSWRGKLVVRSAQKSVLWKRRVTNPGCGMAVLPRVLKVIAPLGPLGGAGGFAFSFGGDLLPFHGRRLLPARPAVPNEPPNLWTN